MGAMVKDGLSAETADLVGKVACAGVVFLGYAVLALLLLRALRLRGTGPAPLMASPCPAVSCSR